MEKLIKCKLCDAEMASQANACPSCGARKSKPFYKKWWFWAIVAAFLIIITTPRGNRDENKSVILEEVQESEIKEPNVLQQDYLPLINWIVGENEFLNKDDVRIEIQKLGDSFIAQVIIPEHKGENARQFGERTSRSAIIWLFENADNFEEISPIWVHVVSVHTGITGRETVSNVWGTAAYLRLMDDIIWTVGGLGN